MLTGAFLMSNPQASADSTTASVTVGSACTMTATVDTAHSAEISPGASQTGIGSTTLNTICNDAGGFAIYAVGYTNNEYGNNKMSNGTVEFNTGTGTSASNWNMSLSQITTGTYATTIDGGFGSYSAVPATFTKVAHRDSVTDVVSGSSATGSSIALTYGAYISTTQTAGDYVGKVKFTLVHPASETPLQPVPCASGSICYNANGKDVVGTMGSPTITSSDTSATLLASNFSREGYGFAGWNDKFDYTGTFYGPQEDINFESGQYTNDNDGLALYAVWVKSAGSLQTDASSVCSNLIIASTDGTANLASVAALTDQRDNQTYAIAKLPDGKCWMIENLRLESTNSDNSTGALAQGYGKSTTYGNFSGLANAERVHFNTTFFPNSLYDISDGDGMINIYYSDYPEARIPRYNNINTSTRITNPTENTSQMYSYGNYYTWAAAMANTIHYTGISSVDADGKTSESVNTSICPLGWRLPYGYIYGNGATAGGFSYLDIQLGGSGKYADPNTTPTGEAMNKKWRSFPNNYLYSGVYWANYVDELGTSGYYWSSTTSQGDSAYKFLLYTPYFHPGNSTQKKYYGFSVRCVLDS